ncbi:hypothetical protein Droror1_Dr00003564 [Drosera rotundifolia]
MVISLHYRMNYSEISGNLLISGVVLLQKPHLFRGKPWDSFNCKRFCLAPYRLFWDNGLLCTWVVTCSYLEWGDDGNRTKYGKGNTVTVMSTNLSFVLLSYVSVGGLGIVFEPFC